MTNKAKTNEATKKSITKVAQKLDFSKMSDEDIVDLFSESFAKNVGINNGIDSIDVECIRQTQSNSIKLNVTIYGLAGTPTISDFKNNKVKGAKSVTIVREGKGEAVFNLIGADATSLNTNDYIVVYKSI